MELILTCYLTGLASSILLGRAAWKEENFWWRSFYIVATLFNAVLVLAVTAFFILFHDVS